MTCIVIAYLAGRLAFATVLHLDAEGCRTYSDTLRAAGYATRREWFLQKGVGK